MEMKISYEDDLMEQKNKGFRQPIVCVLGHVDHGKTTLLDAIRGTSIAKGEAGGITQRIGATDIDAARIERIAKDLLKGSKLKIPGLLFIDTPGHVAFANMRSRGGALADIAILVVDINDGIMPQTAESINILKKFKTPFIVAANKIDLIDLYRSSKSKLVLEALKEQREEYLDALDKKLYNLVSSLFSYGFSSDRYDRISDFSKTLAIVPLSAKSGLGIPDLLMVISGLAQKFLENDISVKGNESGLGTIIEVKIESSLGTTLDTILYQGKIKRGDTIALDTKNGPKTTKVKALFVNSGRTMKDLKERERINAAAGIRILISDKYEVIPGSPLMVIKDDPSEAFKYIIDQSKPNVKLSEDGVTVRADALGSLEAISYELAQNGIHIRNASIGDITRRDITDISTINNPLDRVIVGFNVSILPEARNSSMSTDIAIINGNVIYSLVDECKKWIQSKAHELEEIRKDSMPIPSKITIMPEYIFRSTKPVIVGVRVHSGRIKVGDSLIKSDGRYGGVIKSIREGEISKKFAEAGTEVAVAIDGVTLNRQILPGETLFVDINENVVRNLRQNSLDPETMKTLDEIIRIKRKDNIFWGTKA
jgi:translation initiation factor 5B